MCSVFSILVPALEWLLSNSPVKNPLHTNKVRLIGLWDNERSVFTRVFSVEWHVSCAIGWYFRKKGGEAGRTKTISCNSARYWLPLRVQWQIRDFIHKVPEAQGLYYFCVFFLGFFLHADIPINFMLNLFTYKSIFSFVFIITWTQNMAPV